MNWQQWGGIIIVTVACLPWILALVVKIYTTEFVKQVRIALFGK